VKIAIIGAGIGGLAAALALAQAGFAVEVYERAPALVDQGAGITMAPNATRVLFHLGLESALLSTAASPEATEYRHYRTGEVLMRIDHRDSRARYGYPHLRFHRWDLLEAMATRLARIAPGALRVGRKLDGLRFAGRSVVMSFADGQAIPADLVVAADGIRSAVRDILFGPTSATFTGFVAWRGLVPTAHLPPALSDSVVSFGNGRNIVRYPVRRGELVNFVAAARRDSWEAEGWTIPASHGELISESPSSTRGHGPSSVGRNMVLCSNGACLDGNRCRHGVSDASRSSATRRIRCCRSLGKVERWRSKTRWFSRALCPWSPIPSARLPVTRTRDARAH
jgi:salicylate hydroxylase